MTAKIIHFCDICNLDRYHQVDRRQARVPKPEGKLLQFPTQERRAKSDRRQHGDRRERDLDPPDGTDRRTSNGRRPFDGYAWFEGVMDDALERGWDRWKRELHGEGEGDLLICPRCSHQVHEKNPYSKPYNLPKDNQDPG
ncbi:MAG: hypothetical protein HQL53_05180 [Magnetococcales bacterium]|nr:hypothetical protein [Magnetococcales bacterium]